MRRQALERLVQGAQLDTGPGANGRRVIRRPEAGGADLGDAAPGGQRQDAQAVDVAGLALVDGHAVGGVALDVLHGDVVFPNRQLDVGGGDVVLEVHPLAVGRHAGREPVGLGVQGLGEIAIGATDRRYRLARGAGHETAVLLVPLEPAAGLGVQVQGRAPATGHGQQVAVQGFPRPLQAIFRQAPYHQLPQRPSAAGMHHAVAQPIHDPRHRGPPQQFRRHPGAHIDDGCDPHAVLRQLQRRMPGGVVVAEENDALAQGQAIAVTVLPHRTGEHDAGPVVVGKHQRPFQGAGGQHHAPGADAPEDLPRCCAVRARPQMIPHPLQGGQQVVIVVSVDRGPGHQGQVRAPGDALQPAGQPGPVRRIRARQQAAAGFLLLVQQQHPAARILRRRQRRFQARAAGAHDHHLRVHGLLQVVLRIRLRGCLSQPRQAPHQAFPVLPAGPDEGLVVEARRQHFLQQAQRCQQVPARRRPGILALRHQALVQWGQRGPCVRLGPAIVLKLHQRTGIFPAGGQHAPGPVQLEAAPDNADAIGQQRRGQGVPGVTAQGLALELEGHRLPGIHPRMGQALAAALHASPPAASATSGFGAVMA